MYDLLHENNAPSWANAALGALGHNSNPAKIQLLIRKFFEETTSTIRIPGSESFPSHSFIFSMAREANTMLHELNRRPRVGGKCQSTYVGRYS
mmetsp:Transcript_19513/g.34271  ORF Transcript_19513/g.34271 Transcript_19513/m.34271 type:complete len:93 (+) Transcript_19513:252-530(+)